MIVITVVDDDFGLMFNNRRLSTDRVLRERITEISKDAKLYMSPYTAKQFDPLPGNAIVSEDFLAKAGEGDFCFAEDKALIPFKDKIKKFYLYHWNRHYPSDEKLDFLPGDNGMKLIKTTDFTGNSHEKITEEVFSYEGGNLP